MLKDFLDTTQTHPNLPDTLTYYFAYVSMMVLLSYLELECWYKNSDMYVGTFPHYWPFNSYPLYSGTLRLPLLYIGSALTHCRMARFAVPPSWKIE